MLNAFVVRRSLYHVEQRVQRIERVSHNNDAFVRLELRATYAFREVCFHDPNPVCILSFTFQSHVLQLLVHRSAEVAVGSCVDSCQLLEVSSQEGVATSRVTRQDDLLYKVRVGHAIGVSV